MTAVITLIAAPDSRCLTKTVYQQVVAHIGDNALTAPQWLAADEACTSSLPGTSAADCVDLKHAIATRLSGLPVDVHLTTSHAATAHEPAMDKKKLLIADMESTIICEELIDELAARTGRGDEIAAITTQAMRGELEFAEALKSRVTQFEGLSANVLDVLYQNCVTVMPGAETLVKTMNAHGATTALVSGGFTVFTARIAKRLGFASHRGNTLEIVDGIITGRVTPPILDRPAKAKALQDLAERHAVRADETLAVGDGANDIDMLKAAGLGVAFRGKPVVAEAADIAVQHGDLTSLLYVQGYTRDAFVTA